MNILDHAKEFKKEIKEEGSTESDTPDSTSTSWEVFTLIKGRQNSSPLPDQFSSLERMKQPERLRM
jgi:hypothetical protein